MSRSKKAPWARLAALGLAGATLLALAPAAQTQAQESRRNCFFTTQWTNSKAASPTVIYLRINISDYYKLTLAGGGSQQLLDPTYHLVNIVRGSPTICSAIDLDLKVSNSRGFAVPVIAKSLVKLTPEEAAAIPKKDRP